MLAAAERQRRQRLLARLAFASTALVLVVVVSSAYLRLVNAGLGCDDWPRCYGRLQANSTDLATHVAPAQSIVRLTHRLAAMVVSVLNLLIAYLCWTQESATLGARATAVLVIALTVFLSLLGRATTGTHLPVVTLGNLLGGLAMLALLWWVWLTTTAKDSPPASAGGWARMNLTLVAGQIVLGALLTARYGGPSCASFPDCNGAWWPSAFSWSELNPMRTLQYHSDGAVISTPALQALNMLHRLGALLVACSAAAVGVLALRQSEVRRVGVALLAAVALAIVLGIAAAQMGFPLAVVLAHNAAAALLLLAALTVYQRLRAT